MRLRAALIAGFSLLLVALLALRFIFPGPAPAPEASHLDAARPPASEPGGSSEAEAPSGSPPVGNQNGGEQGASESAFSDSGSSGDGAPEPSRPAGTDSGAEFLRELESSGLIAPEGAQAVGRMLAEALAQEGPAEPGQVREEDIARAFDLLGQLLGLPDVTPEELKRRVEEVGGLRFARDVPMNFMSREELTRYLRQLFEAEYPAEVAEREERVLRAFGFLDPRQDLRTIRERVLNEAVAGFYDERPSVKKLFAVSSGRTLNLMNQLILAHELRHALQDQHADFGKILPPGNDYDDRKLAVLCLLEGDATLLMQMYMSGGSRAATDLGGFGSLAGLEGRAIAEMFAGPELRGAPPVVREQLVSPYLDGQALAAQIFARGGFRLLNSLLRDPPRSMEQVLHPEKYLDRREDPIPVASPLPEGESILPESEGQLGEFFVRVLFHELLPEESALRAAGGWGGDRYALWRDERGGYRLAWQSIWDSDTDAEEFYEAMARAASVRFGEGPTLSPLSPELSLKGVDGSTTLLRRQGREVRLERANLH